MIVEDVVLLVQDEIDRLSKQDIPVGLRQDARDFLQKKRSDWKDIEIYFAPDSDRPKYNKVVFSVGSKKRFPAPMLQIFEKLRTSYQSEYKDGMIACIQRFFVPSDCEDVFINKVEEEVNTILRAHGKFDRTLTTQLALAFHPFISAPPPPSPSNPSAPNNPQTSRPSGTGQQPVTGPNFPVVPYQATQKGNIRLSAWFHFNNSSRHPNHTFRFHNNVTPINSVQRTTTTGDSYVLYNSILQNGRTILLYEKFRAATLLLPHQPVMITGASLSFHQIDNDVANVCPYTVPYDFVVKIP